MDWLSWVITAFVLLLLAGWFLYIGAAQSLPSGQRPKVAQYDRFGQLLGKGQAPDYHIMAGEDSRGEDSS